MIVVDTNVLAYYFAGFASPLATAAIEWRQRDSAWRAPAFWRSEFRNVLANYLRAKWMTPGVAAKIWREADAAMAGGTLEVDAERVLALVAQSGCSAYDCEYVELAQRLGAPLLTADKKLIAAFPKICLQLTPLPT